MSPHVLTLIVLMSNGDIVETRVGTLANRRFCDLAGQGITRLLIDEDPSLTVGWTCEAEGVSA